MRVFAQAKVNVALDVTGKDDHGYHLLDMIMAPVSLYDEIEIEMARQDSVLCLEMRLPEVNTITKTMKMLREHFPIQNHYSIVIHKNIPEQAGLAGGSADAAAVMKAVCAIENIHLDNEQAFELSKLVGADVPFCYYNKWARVQGIGEKITPISCDIKMPILLVKPNFGISTPLSFKMWDENPTSKVNVDTIQKALEHKEYSMFYKAMDNALEPIAMQIEPSLEKVKLNMMMHGLQRVMMSGSGSSMMGFSDDRKVLENAKDKLKEIYPFVEIVTVG